MRKLLLSRDLIYLGKYFLALSADSFVNYRAVASRMERNKFVWWSSINSLGQAARLFSNS